MSDHPLVVQLNAVLSRGGLPRTVATIDEISSNSSSLLVASFEAVFSSSISDIRRRPGNAVGVGGGGGSAAADHAFNAQRVIDSLAALLPPSITIPPKITGLSVAGGDLAALAFLLSILNEASAALVAAGSGAALSTDNALANLSESSLAAATADLVCTAASTATGNTSPTATSASGALLLVRSLTAGEETTMRNETDEVSWLAHAAVGAAGNDLWSSTTPQKLHEKAAVKLALVGGGDTVTPTPCSSAKPPPPPPCRSTSLAASAKAEYNSKRAGAGGEGLLAADMKMEDDNRRAEALKLSDRRAKGLMTRMAHSAAQEIAQIAMMTKSAVRAREVDLRNIEARALAAATSRAKAAKHERKVLTMRTKLVVENLTRQTLSMRIGRSSRQAAATSTLLKALAGQARLGAADKLKAAASERSGMLVDASSRVAWLNHTSAMLNEVILEETAKQIAQRQAATRSQKEALDRAIREMSLDENALLKRMKDEQAHAEDSFLATQVEPMEINSGVGNATAIATQRINDHTDTDANIERVDTMARAHRILAQGRRKMNTIRAAADSTINLIAKDIGAEIAHAEGMENHGNRLVGQGRV